MATSDLQSELENPNFKTDLQTESRLCRVVLQQMEDSSSDISSIAVKCLSLLVHRVSVDNTEDVLRSLCASLLSPKKKEQERDIAGIGLKAAISEIHGGKLAARTAKIVIPEMIRGINTNTKKDNKEASFDLCNECLGILHEVIRKFGSALSEDTSRNVADTAEAVLECLLPLMDEPRAGIRKRVIHCIASLSTHLNNALLGKVCNEIFEPLSNASVTTDASQAYLHLLGAVSRSVGYRFGCYLPKAIPLIMKHCDSAGEEDCEVRENCLQALESFVECCPQDTRHFLDPILDLCLRYLSYDPNYDMDLDNTEDEDEDMDDDDNISEEEYSDDEDMSWKVRRAAAKCLSAVIASYHDLLEDIYPKASAQLVSRFREREETVKTDVFSSFVELLKATRSKSAGFDVPESSHAVSLLRKDVPVIMKAASRQLKEKSVKTKVGVFAMLRELLTVLNDAAEAHIPDLMPGILSSLQDKGNNSGLKIEGLMFLNAAMARSSAQTFRPHIPVLAPPVLSAVNERYYKVTSEALRVCEEMARVIYPGEEPLSPELQGITSSLYEAVLVRLTAQDQDQEVKERAISCMAVTVALLGNYLNAQQEQVLNVLLERLRNEITRLTAVKAFSTITSSPLRLDLSPVLSPAVAELTSFLRKANRLLRQASLETLIAMVKSQSEALGAAELDALVVEAANLVTDEDLHLAAQSLRLCCTLLAAQPPSAQAIGDKVLPKAMTLVQSQLLQGVGLEALQQFFAAVAASGAPGGSFENLLQSLLSYGAAAHTPKAAQSSIAKCIAALCHSAGTEHVNSTVSSLLAKLKAPDNAQQQRLDLLVIGEIGRRENLALFDSVKSTINMALESPLDEIKSAGSMALGGVAVGSLETFLPFLLEQIGTQSESSKHQYMLLKSLNEVIASVTKGTASGGARLEQAQQEHILQLLLKNCESEEECRNVVAECAGSLALLNPSFVIPQLQSLVESESSAMRWLVVTALRYAITEKPSEADKALAISLPPALMCIADADRHVRRAAVLTLSSVSHNKPSLIRDNLPDLLPALYGQTVVREDLIRIVDLGPFKHKIDDGLELRKAAFECMDMVMDQCASYVDYAVFVQHLESGLKDHYDVKMPCHSMLAKLAQRSPHTVLAHIEGIVPLLEKTLTAKLKSDAVKQEVDRNDDMLRSCLRAVDAVARIPSVDSNSSFSNFMKNVVQAGPMAAKYQAVKEERQEAEVTAVRDRAAH